MKRGLVVFMVLVAAAPLVALAACSSSPKLVAAGGDCFQATDCQDGLVCAPLQDGRRVCTSDLSGIQTTEEAGGGGDAAAAGDGPTDGPVPGDGPVQTDDGPTGDDTGLPPDTGSPPPDSGD